MFPAPPPPPPIEVIELNMESFPLFPPLDDVEAAPPAPTVTV
jgi:hypothetical protein